MAGEKLTVWVTKYALSSGIEQREAERSRTNPEFVKLLGGWSLMALGSEAHLTREAAVADANKRRDAKIKSLEKQIAKLKTKVFE